jgi:transposase
VLLAAITAAGAPAVIRWQLAGELVADVRQLEQRITAVEARIKAAVAESNTSLGTAPLEASSGQVVRHRLSWAGDRRLNHALYMMAMAQVRRPSADQHLQPSPVGLRPL